MKISVIYGSVRSERRGIRAAKFIVNKLEERGHDVALVDPVEFSLPLLDKMHNEYEQGNAPDTMERVATILRESDGFVVVSGEYNHSIPPALKNLLDTYQKEYHFKPSAIVTYSKGPFGGVRGVSNLRAILGELGTPSIPSMLPISRVQDAFDDAGNTIEKSYDRRVAKFLDEFEWYLNAFKAGREKGVPY